MNKLSVAERKELIAELNMALESNTLIYGDVIKTIRKKLYGMTQTQYAKFINVSDKTLRDIEKGNTDPRISVVNKLLAPGGFQLSPIIKKHTI